MIPNIPMTFEISREVTASFQRIAPGLERRDLSFAQATAGAAHACIYRMDGQIEMPEFQQRNSFEFFFVLRGKLEIHSSAGVENFGAADAAWQQQLFGSGLLHASAGLEVLHISAPLGSPIGASQAINGEPLVSRNHSGAFGSSKGGPRDFFAYRDFGVAPASLRQVDIQLLAALKPREGGTGWHSHSMGQLFVVLSGSAVIDTTITGPLVFTAGDAMVLPNRMIHNVPQFSADYSLLQMQFPADYETFSETVPTAK